MRKLVSVLLFHLAIIMSLGLSSCSSDSSSSPDDNDSTSPSVAITNLAANQNILTTYTVQVEASDDKALKSVSLFIDGSVFETIEAKEVKTSFFFTVNFGSLSSGNHTVYALAYDTSNNSSSTNTITVNNTDQNLPTVAITNLTNGQLVSGLLDINVDATDNIGIDHVSLYIDGTLVGTQTKNKAVFSFTVNFNNYTDGSRSVYAVAYDTSNNSKTSNTYTINSEYDFTPYGDGKIRVSIDHYKELDPLDITGYGDPYFIFKLYINDVLYDEHTTATFTDTHEISTPVYYDFNIPDKTRQIKVSIFVYDEDGTTDDVVDYTESAAGIAYQWTLNTLNLNVTNSYSGADDGLVEDDCELTRSIKSIY